MKTGIHITPCNVGSAEKHNRRDKDYLEKLDASGKKTYDIFRDETHLNKGWVNPKYRGRTLPEILEDDRQEVKAKTGRAMQEKATPIREGVCPIRPTTTLSDFQPVVDWFARHGAAVIRIDLHRDEGHTDAVTGERKHNHHAHLVLDFIDHRTGKSVKLTKQDTSDLQTVIAEALGMERGTSVDETGSRHLAAQEYREKKAGESAARLEAKAAELQKQVKAHQAEADRAQRSMEDAQQREAAAVEKAAEAEKAASRQQLRSNAADVGARLLNVIGRGAVAEANTERDEALERADSAEQQAAADRQARQIAEEAAKVACEERDAARATARRAEANKAAYGREMYENGVSHGYKQGRESVQQSIAPLQQQLAAKQSVIDKLQGEREDRAEAYMKEMRELEKWNPRVHNWRSSLSDMKAAGLTDDEIKTVFAKGQATVQVNIKHNYKDYPVETTVAIGTLQTAANKRTFGVWFKAAFDNAWHGVRSFLEKAQQHIRSLQQTQVRHL